VLIIGDIVHIEQRKRSKKSRKKVNVPLKPKFQRNKVTSTVLEPVFRKAGTVRRRDDIC